MFTFDDDLCAALKKACDHDSDDDAMHLVRAARIVRKEMFDQKFTFSGGGFCERHAFCALYWL